MARKLNTKFIVGVAVLGVVGGAGLWFGPALMRPSIAKLTAQGEAAFKAGDYEGATNFLGRAVNRQQNNVPLAIELIDAMDYTVHGDPAKFQVLRQIQAKVLATDPRSVPALRRVLTYQLNDVRNAPAENVAVRNLINTAQRLLELQPGDKDAQKALVTAVLEPYARNLEVLPEEVDRQRDSAKAMYDKDPTDTEALQMLVRFHLIAAQRAAQQADDQAVQSELDTLKSLADAGIKNTPQDGVAWMLRFNVYGILAQLTPGRPPELLKTVNEVRGDALEQANKFVDPKNGESFLTIRAMWLRIQELKNVKDAEAGYRKLLTELPNDRQPRIMLADFLDRQPARRDEAAAVLEKPWVPVGPIHAIESRRQAVNALVEQVRLCTIKLGAIEIVKDPADRERRLKEVQKLYADLQAVPDINTMMHPAMLRLEGGIALEQGHILDAITTLDAALKLLSPDSPYSLEQEMRNDVLLQYAQAQLRLGQTGEARPRLKELVDRRPDNLIARATLADVLIREHNYNDAAHEVGILQKLIPGNPMIEQMNVRLLALRSDALREHYKDMPETTRDQRLIKLQAAEALGDGDELIRVARMMLQADATDAEALTVLAQALIRTNHRDEAVAAVDTALLQKPNDPRLVALQSAISAQTPEQQTKLVETQISQIKVPLDKALAEADFARQQGKFDDSAAALKRAIALNADDPRAPDALFKLSIARQKWDDAQGLLDTLTKLNVDQTNGQIRRIQLSAAKALAEPAGPKRDDAFKDILIAASTLSQQYREIATASLMYAQILQQTGALADAADEYARTLEKSPTNADALVGSVQCLLALSRPGEARTRLDQANSAAPDDARLRQLELSYQMQFGDPLRAIDSLQAAINQNPKNPLAWGQMGVALDQIAKNKTAAHDDAAAKQFTQRAADLYEKASAQFPDDLRFPVALAEDKRQMADPSGAEQVFVKLTATDKYKDNPEAVELLASQYSRSGKADDAERVMRDLIARVKPAPVSTVLKLSWLYAQQQRMQDALNTLDIRSDNAEVQRQRVQLLVASNSLDKARTAIEEALAHDPSADTYLIAAYVELRSGNFTKADGFLKKVFQERPNDAAALFYRAQVRLNASPPDLNSARDDLSQACDIAPGNLEARVALADVYFRKQDPATGISELQKAWKYNPTSKTVLLKLSEAYAASKPPAWSSVQKLIADAKQNPQLASDPDVILLDANTCIAVNDPQKAQVLAKQALAVAPNNPDLQQRYFDVLLRAKAYRELIAASEPVLQADRGAWWLYRLRGQAYHRLDESVNAGQQFDAALNLVTAANNEQATTAVIRTVAEEMGVKAAIAKTEPLAAKDNAYRLILAGLYQGDHNLADMYEQLNRVLADRPRLRDDQVRQALQLMGSYYLQASPPDLKKARSTFEELLKLSPNDVLVLNNLADVLSQPESGGTPAEALQYSQHAFDLASTFNQSDLTLYVWDTQGWVLVQNKRMDEGIDLLRRAAQTAQFPDVYIHLAEANLMTDNVEGADLALTDARKILDRYDRQKLSVDPQLRPKMEQLSAEIANRRTAKPAAG